MIVGLSPGAVPFSRELDPLFRSEIREPPSRIGRTVHLPWLGLAVRRLLAIWRFRADADGGCFVGLRVPGFPGEPQSTSREQRRYGQQQSFSFHCFALCADFRELTFDLERRQGIVAPSAGERE